MVALGESLDGLTDDHGVAGYRLTVGGDRDRVTRRFHALNRHLKSAGVTTITVKGTSTVTGDFEATDQTVSYLADGIVFLWHVEIDGELQKAIGVPKETHRRFRAPAPAVRDHRERSGGGRAAQPHAGRPHRHPGDRRPAGRRRLNRSNYQHVRAPPVETVDRPDEGG